MSTLVLATKLYIPPPRPKAVLRTHLIARMNESLTRKLTLISAPAGFGKSSLMSEWAISCPQPVAWLSLDEGDNDPKRFLTYLIAALQTIAPQVGEGILGGLQSLQSPPIEAILTSLLNDISALADDFVLVLDDYHVMNARASETLSFLLDHQPPQMHLVIATREDPPFPLARLRARGQMTELRVADLRFTPDEAAEFLNQVMGLSLSAENIAVLETRTEGWIVGLQLVALSLQGQKNTHNFIQSFSGSHHFVLDYLIEEVLQQQSESVQTFLLHTSILDRMRSSLCDAVLREPGVSSQDTLLYLERANLFIVPLDNERRWYRYHHLFAELLRHRLRQSAASSNEDLNEYHKRASQWYEDNGLEIEAFHHAAAANDIERAERLIEGRGIPLHFRGAVTAMLDWLHSLPLSVMNARPSLWWSYASLLLVNGQTTGVDEKLDAAEAALQDVEEDSKTRNLIGQIAAARATLALTRYQLENLITQSHRALEYLPPENLPYRATAHWTLGLAYLYQGHRAAARQTFTESISFSQQAGDTFTTILAMGGMGNVQEAENQLYLAAETYQHILQVAGDQPLQIIAEVHLGLARVLYEWNDLETAQRHGEQSLQLARQYDSVIDRFIISEIFMARLRLAQGDVEGAVALLAQTEQAVIQHNFSHRVPEVAAVRVLALLRQGHVSAAAHLAQKHQLPISQARVSLAQGDASAALALLEPLRQHMEAQGWVDERLKITVLQAVAHHMQGEKHKAAQIMDEALALAESGGFRRLFVDEGLPMKQLLLDAVSRGAAPNYARRVLAAFAPVETGPAPQSANMDTLSERELEVLRHVAEGRTNQEIADRLHLSLFTVKVHARNIYSKLGVNSRTLAAAKARELGLLPRA